MSVIKSQKSIVRKNSAGSDFSRRRINFIEGSNVTLTVADDSTDNETDVTITAAGFSSPLTTKGDLYGRNTVDARIPIGTNGDVLTADSTQTLGLKWAAPGAASMAIGSAITSSTAGSVLYVGGSNDLQQDNAGLFFNNTDNALGVGTATPATVAGIALGRPVIQVDNQSGGQSNLAAVGDQGAGFYLYDRSGGADGKWWDFFHRGDFTSGRRLTDAGGVGGYFINFDHTTGFVGIGPSNYNVAPATMLDVNGVITARGNILPGTNDGAVLGSTTKQFSDLFLAEGAVINFDNGDATITQSGNTVTLAGADFAVPDEAYGATWNGSSNVPTKNAVYDEMQVALDSNWLKGLQALGSVIIATTLGGPPNSSTALVDNRAQFYAVYLDKPATITGVKWYQATQGVYTADQNNYVALYSYSAGTLTQVAISANDGNIWKEATGAVGSAAFETPYVAAAGIYFVGLLYNSSAQTTAPALAHWAGTSGTIADFTNSAKLYGTLTGQNSLPTPQVSSGLTVTSSGIWLGLY